jgi:dienelactone hydrolase
VPVKTYRRAALCNSLVQSLAVLIVLAAVLAACGGDDPEQRSETGPFAYDRSRPLGLVVRQVERLEGVQVRDLSFTGRNGRIPAFLLVPGGRGLHPAVVYVHGAGGGRGDLLAEAMESAKLGAVTLALEMPFGERRSTGLPRGLEGVRVYAARERQSVIEVRRAIDLLQSLPEVADDRIAYVGWSAGGRIGAVLAGVEPRIRAFNLHGTGASPVSEYTPALPPEVKPEVERLLTEVDPLRHVQEHGEAEIFFQNGRRDEIVPREALATVVRAASEPKDVRWYDSGHRPSDRAWAESRRWLAQRLGLDAEPSQP